MLMPALNGQQIFLKKMPGIKGYIAKNFKFSPKVSAVCISLACVMIWCSTWQWERYKNKVELVKTYRDHKDSVSLSFPTQGKSLEDFQEVLDRRVSLAGTYDYSKQIIVTNRKDVSGPGHWLLTPFKIKDSSKHVIVSRGFIPFADRTPETWGKYSYEQQGKIEAVVKQSVDPKPFGPQNPSPNDAEKFPTLWYYPEIKKLHKQFPYEVIPWVYVQRLGDPLKGKFPAEAIRIKVPPSTHFGYTIEWAALAFVTLMIGLIIQVLPKKKRYRKENSEI